MQHSIIVLMAPGVANVEVRAESVLSAEQVLVRLGFAHQWAFSWLHVDGTKAVIVDRRLYVGREVDVRRKQGELSRSFYRSMARAYRQAVREQDGIQR